MRGARPRGRRTAGSFSARAGTRLLAGRADAQMINNRHSGCKPAALPWVRKSPPSPASHHSIRGPDARAAVRARPRSLFAQSRPRSASAPRGAALVAKAAVMSKIAGPSEPTPISLAASQRLCETAVLQTGGRPPTRGATLPGKSDDSPARRTGPPTPRPPSYQSRDARGSWRIWRTSIPSSADPGAPVLRG